MRMVRVRSRREMQDALLLHDKAGPHTSLRTTETITILRWTDAPPDFQLFGPMKNVICGQTFWHGKEVIKEVKIWLKQT